MKYQYNFQNAVVSKLQQNEYSTITFFVHNVFLFLFGKEFSKGFIPTGIEQKDQFVTFK